MYTVANALMSLLFSPPYLTFWAVIIAPACVGIIHRIISVNVRI